MVKVGLTGGIGTGARSGWAAFAGIVLVLVGAFNAIFGLTAIFAAIMVSPTYGALPIVLAETTMIGPDDLGLTADVLPRILELATLHRTLPSGRASLRPQAFSNASDSASLGSRSGTSACRRMSQLDLALSAQSSARHLSFLENDRARPVAAGQGRLEQIGGVTGALSSTGSDQRGRDRQRCRRGAHRSLPVFRKNLISKWHIQI